MRYVELMDAMQFELAAEYLLMAAMLAEIKSRMLLPRSSGVEEDEEDLWEEVAPDGQEQDGEEDTRDLIGGEKRPRTGGDRAEGVHQRERHR